MKRSIETLRSENSETKLQELCNCHCSERAVAELCLYFLEDCMKCGQLVNTSENWFEVTHHFFPPESNSNVIPRLTVPPLLHPLPPAHNTMYSIITSSPSLSAAPSLVAVAPPSGSSASPIKSNEPILPPRVSQVHNSPVRNYKRGIHSRFSA